MLITSVICCEDEEHKVVFSVIIGSTHEHGVVPPSPLLLFACAALLDADCVEACIAEPFLENMHLPEQQHPSHLRGSEGLLAGAQRVHFGGRDM